MTRQPATLSYLAIVNPKLRALEKIKNDDGDEDADQRAQILFYTSKENAVSQGRMLRQVGLAQALMAFSANLCGETNEFHDIHAMKSRMTLISPEPDYWIYAQFDLGRSQQLSSKTRSAKGKGRDKTPGVDYHDTALSDEGLKAHIRRSYEEFKLRNGTFSMVLETEGRAILEQLLERHFACWTWGWDVEQSISRFETHKLNLQMHPQYSQIANVIESYSSAFLFSFPLVVLDPPYVVRAPGYSNRNPRGIGSTASCPAFPPSLLSLLLRLLSPNRRKPALETILNQPIAEPSARDLTEKQKEEKESKMKLKSGFKVPPMTLDPRKWALGSLLTPSTSWTSKGSKEGDNLNSSGSEGPVSETVKECTENSIPNTEFQTPGNSHEQESDLSDSQMTIRLKSSESRSTNIDTREEEETTKPDPGRAEGMGESAVEQVDFNDDEEAVPSVQYLDLYLPGEAKESGFLEKRTMGYAKDSNLIIAIVLPSRIGQAVPPEIAKELIGLLAAVKTTLQSTEASEKKATLSTKIFASDEHFFASDPPLSKYSEHSFDTWRELKRPDICEVISRPMASNRPWMAGKRELPTESGAKMEDEVYLELMGTDSTLVDVDRALSNAYSNWSN